MSISNLAASYDGEYLRVISGFGEYHCEPTYTHNSIRSLVSVLSVGTLRAVSHPSTCGSPPKVLMDSLELS